MEDAHNNRVLVAHPDAGALESLVRMVARSGRLPASCRDVGELMERLTLSDFDALVLSERIVAEHEDVFDRCRHIHDDWPQLPVLLVGEVARQPRAATQALRAGAADLLAFPPDAAALDAALTRALSRPRAAPAVHRLSQPEGATELGLPGLDAALVGWGPAMREVAQRVRHASAHDVPVLVTGESGTGKELVAQALHQLGARRAEPFVAVNCAAVPAELMESELFGHARGAFTSAVSPRRGLLLQAHRGTLFFDEIDSMPMELQPKLLRALEERTVRPLGMEEEVCFDARVVSACSHDPSEAVHEGRFREDLRYRLDVLRVDLPPLRERGDDVLALAEQFLQQYSHANGKAVRGMTDDVAARLRRYPWPGNVRELRNCIERAVTVTRGERIGLHDLPLGIRRYRPSQSNVRLDTDLPTLHELEDAYIEDVLGRVGGNKVKAAELLGISRATLYRRLRRNHKD